jgi:triosephosphate isomerase (TIM)
MKNLIIANWKMNPTTQKEAKTLFDAVKKEIKNVKSEVVICPPFVFLSELKGLIIGSQNAYFEEKGAFTGEVSSEMLKDLKVEYVILGHSERRKYFAETDEQINKKIKKVLSVGLKPIFCIGETADQRDEGKKQEILGIQIKNGLAGIDLPAQAENIKNITIAYEPVWAIGTGNNCSIQETKDSILFIRRIILELYGKEIANNIKILYGGSVKSENAASYIKEAEANGLLVGGASLNAEEFGKIVKSAE